MSNDRADFDEFVASFPVPVLEFLAEPETRIAMDRAAAKLWEIHGEEGSNDYYEGMMEGLKCGLVVFYDMCMNGDEPGVLEACLMGGIVSSVAFVEQCFRVIEGRANDESREPDGT